MQEHLFLVCELLRANLYEFQKYNRDHSQESYFTLARVQSIARQVRFVACTRSARSWLFWNAVLDRRVAVRPAGVAQPGVHALSEPHTLRPQAGEHPHQILQQVPPRPGEDDRSQTKSRRACGRQEALSAPCRCQVKVIDLGSSCFTTDHLSSYVQSRSYRAPEVILGLPYHQQVDIWSLGCILAELLSGYVLFQVGLVASLA